MDIAVFLDKTGRTQSFAEAGIVTIYSGTTGKWRVTKEVIFRIDKIDSLKIVRESIKNMAEDLDECKVFVGSEIKGIPYNVLDGMGFNTWELEGTPKEFLDFVFNKEEEEAKSVARSESGDQLPLIQKCKDGNYFVDLKKIQLNNANVTSKGILLPFLNTTTFFKLQIICSHVPPWFKDEFKRLNLKAERQIINQGEIMVTVCSKVCGE